MGSRGGEHSYCVLPGCNTTAHCFHISSPTSHKSAELFAVNLMHSRQLIRQILRRTLTIQATMRETRGENSTEI
jgi:hypothetical protein